MFCSRVLYEKDTFEHRPRLNVVVCENCGQILYTIIVVIITILMIMMISLAYISRAYQYDRRNRVDIISDGRVDFNRQEVEGICSG